MGIVERAVFTSLTFLVLGFKIFDLGGDLGHLLTAAIAWIGVKTIVGWRRYQEASPAIMALSMVSITGSLLSISIAVMAALWTKAQWD